MVRRRPALTRPLDLPTAVGDLNMAVRLGKLKELDDLIENPRRINATIFMMG